MKISSLRPQAGTARVAPGEGFYRAASTLEAPRRQGIPMSFMDWYNALDKPSWTPDPAFIGLMWQIIYPIILVTFLFVFVQAFRKKIPRLAALPFVLNLLSNLAFTPIQFGLRSLSLAALDIVIVWATIVWMSIVIWRHYRWVAVAQLPYFLWVSVATVLQLSITWMNR